MTAVQTLSEYSAQDLLCLLCRGSGHLPPKCPNEDAGYELDWFISEARREFTSAQQCDLGSICPRCESLDLERWLQEDLPFTGDRELQKFENDPRVIKDLGSVGTCIIRKDCSLCRCIFGMSPNASSTIQKVKLVRSWSMYRLEASMNLDTSEKRSITQYIAVWLDPTTTGLSIEDMVSTRGDGICAVKNESADNKGLYACKMDPRRIDMARICRWISLCQELHPLTCVSPESSNLKKICLINTNTRSLVSYSDETERYLALSYTWGGVDQRFPTAGIPGTALGPLSQTIEDAIMFVNDLGESYLWVDSVCVEQENSARFEEQLAIMSDIYQSAYATIIAFSGDSATHGLSRVGSTTTSYRQLECKIGDTHFVSFGPTLSQLVWLQPWGQRAWTYQEAILSQRCIYISDYHVYFECNAMTCCESIDEMGSHTHQIIRDENYYEGENYLGKINTGVLRSPLAGNRGLQKNAFQLYALHVNLYSRRFLSKRGDAKSAFSGILQALQRAVYPNGFFWALPTVDMDWALLWNGESRASTRKDFPTWSWLSHGGHVWPMEPAEEQLPTSRQHPFKLSIWIGSIGTGSKIFEMSYDQPGSLNRSHLHDDPLDDRLVLQDEDVQDKDSPQTLEDRSIPSEDVVLGVESYTIQLSPDVWTPCDQSLDLRYFRLRVKGVQMYALVSVTGPLYDDFSQIKDYELLLLTRERRTHHNIDYITHHLRLLEQKGEFWESKSTVSLDVPARSLWILKDLGLRRRRVLLI